MSSLIIFKSKEELEREALQLFCDNTLEAIKDIDKEKERNEKAEAAFREALESSEQTVVGPDEDWGKAIEKVEHQAINHEKKIISLPGGSE